ncbi:hypothetical protein [Alkalihalobacillus pseudalcaliphilus]|uniref:hypothetical protein n=1 Tax=Alkalihalobacillus pseudalcaliphilus TaxID=79884 RepID=UPI00064DDBC8|nr:hypothetical protein [Alkalihalobacillus pseudalcaliphilus]KMK76346.1 hypothetical protein AB990_14185 [Alkalihalobacillus pseudalcaliphilus]
MKTRFSYEQTNEDLVKVQFAIQAAKEKLQEGHSYLDDRQRYTLDGALTYANEQFMKAARFQNTTNGLLIEASSELLLRLKE